MRVTTSEEVGQDAGRAEWRIEVQDPILQGRCYAAVVVDQRNQIVLVGPKHMFSGAFLFNGAILHQLAAALDEAEALVAARSSQEARCV